MKKTTDSITQKKQQNKRSKSLDYKIIQTMSAVAEIKKITENIQGQMCRYNTITRI